MDPLVHRLMIAEIRIAADTLEKNLSRALLRPVYSDNRKVCIDADLLESRKKIGNLYIRIAESIKWFGHQIDGSYEMWHKPNKDGTTLHELLMNLMNALKECEDSNRKKKKTTHLNVVADDFQIPRGRKPWKNVPPVPRAPDLDMIIGFAREPWKPLPAADRMVRVEISFDPKTQIYHRTMWKNGQLLQSFRERKWKRSYHLWFDPEAIGPKPRIPWSRIDAGERWQQDILIWDLYFERRADREYRDRISLMNDRRRLDRTFPETGDI